jgi:DNA-binding Xre family transcriptional regulator
MLTYNFERVFKAKGIDRPFTFLRQAGFSDNFATKVKNNRVSRLDLRLLERLCLKLGCSPNDFMEWTPDKDQVVDKNHPINVIKKTDKIIDMTKTLNSVPLSKLEEIERLINEQLNK